MYSEQDTVIKCRSFDHKGRIYDVSAFIEPGTPSKFSVEVTCNGHDVYYEYPDGVRATQRHEVTLIQAIQVSHAASMNAVDFTMDNAEKLVRTWVK